MAFLEGENILLRALEPEDLDILYQWGMIWIYGNTALP